MARLWTCGFELQSLTAGVEITSNGVNGGGISTATKRSGAAALQLNPAAAFSWAGQVFQSALTTGTVFGRAYINITALPTSGRAQILVFYDATAVAAQASIELNSSGQLQMYNAGSVATVGSASSALSTGTWYCVELSYNASTGAMTARLDGVQFASGTGSTGTGCNACYFGSPAVAATFNIFWDDMAVNDATGSSQTSWCNVCSRIDYLRPNGAGSVNTFATQTGGTAGASNNYTRVNETPPNDVTSYNGSSTLNQEDMFVVGASSLGASDTVAVVQVGFRYAQSTADATAAIKAQIKKSAAGTVTQSAAISPNSTTFKTNSATTAQTFPITLYADPDGTAWTQSTINAMQLGYKLTTAPGTAGRQTRVTAIWAIVESTTPASNFSSTPSDTATVSESSIRKPVKNLADSASSSDSVSIVRPLASSISDNFNDNSIGYLWSTSAANDPARIIEQNSRMEISHTAASQYNALETIGFYNLTGNRFYVQVTDAGNQTLVSHEAILYFSIDINNQIWVTITNGSISTWQRIGGVQVQIGSAITYNSAVHKYLGIRESGGTTYLEYATDPALGWTTINSTTNPMAVTAVRLALQSGCWQAEASGSYAYFDNFNITTGTAFSQTPSDTATSSDAISLRVGKITADSATSTDAISKKPSIPKSDSVTSSDTSIRKPTVNSADSVTTSEASARKAVLNKADTAASSDATIKAVGAAKSDTATVSESIVKKPTKNSADSVTGSDSSSRAVGKGQADSVTPSEASARNVSRASSDTAASSDASARNVKKSPADAATPTDNMNATSGRFLGLSDSATATDATAKKTTLSKSDSASATDTFTKLATYLRLMSDSVTTTDSSTRSVKLSRADTVTATDAIDAHILLRLFLNDSVTPTDATAKSNQLSKSDTVTPADSASRKSTKNTSDSVTISDSMFHTFVVLLQINDSVTAVDATAKLISKTLNDVIITSAAAATGNHWTRLISDGVGTSDAVTKQIQLGKADVAALQDIISKHFSTPRNDSVVLSDEDSKQVRLILADLVGTSDDQTFTSLVRENLTVPITLEMRDGVIELYSTPSPIAPSSQDSTITFGNESTSDIML